MSSTVSLSHEKAMFPEGCAWIEGKYVSINNASVPITDFGFSRSDCTYDVVAVWDGKFFRIDDHIERFKNSCTSIKLSPPFEWKELKPILHRLVEHTGLKNSYVEMIVTRGIPMPGERNPSKLKNRFYGYAIPYVWVIDKEKYNKGVNLIVSEETIRIDQKSVDPKVKNFHWADLTKGLYEAYERNADAVVLCDKEGYLTEGPGYNIFILQKDTLFTPKEGVLEGITRKTVLEIASRMKLDIKIGKIKKKLLKEADEIFLTSTAGGIIPVASLDGRALRKPTREFCQKINDEYWESHYSGPLVEEVIY